MKQDFFLQKIIQFSFVAAAIILSLKLAQLQLFDNQLKEQANNITLQKKTVYPSRGMIFDRNDKLLVVNQPSYDLEVTFSKIDPNIDTLKFCEILEIEKADFIEYLNKDWKSAQYNKAVPFVFMSKIPPKKFARFQEHLHEFSGFEPVLRSTRLYPHQNAAHALGYLGEVNPSHLEKSPEKYSLGDYIGLTGIEKMYDDQLRGSKGISFILRDNLGRAVGKLDEGRLDSAAISGTDIQSTIDIELQAYGEQIFKGKRGSAVAIEPATGEILAMISAPNYDPNDLALSSTRGKVFKELLNDKENKPFLDRSLIAKYPPGSIFKPILALIALQENVLYPGKSISCSGSYEVTSKGFSQGCRDHPSPVYLPSAIQYSCNSYFYQTMKDFLEIEGYTKPGIGLNLLKKYLTEFGIGSKLGVDNSHENSGFFPDAKYFDDKYNTKYSEWRSSYVLSLGIGQGEIELTTLQMANLASILANRGHFYTPHLVKSFINSDHQIPEKFRAKNSVSIDQKNFEPVIDGMHRVVHSGTGYSAYIPGLDICGKTGTSQNYHGNKIDHSVFFAFAPKDDPKIAIAVFVENAGGGSTVAAPIASLIIEKYLKGEVKRTYLEEYLQQLDLLTKT